MIAALPRFWLLAALALYSVSANSQSDQVLSTSRLPSAPRTLPPIAPIAPIQNHADTLLTPEHQGSRVYIAIDQWHSQTDLASDDLARPARHDNLFVIVNYHYTNSTPRPLDPRIHQPRLFLVDPAGQKIAPNRRASQDWRYAQDMDTTGRDKLNPLVTVADVAVFEVSPLLFDPDRWSLMIQDGQNVRIPLRRIPEKRVSSPE